MSHVTWMSQHPDVQLLVADFMQHLLFNKPHDIVRESAAYFATFT